MFRQKTKKIFNDGDDSIPAPALWSWQSRRLRTAIYLAASMLVAALMRASLSMALVCMVKTNTTSDEELQEEECLGGLGRYHVDWSALEQSRLHSAFYVGALLSAFAADFLVRRFGAKHALSIGIVFNAVGAFLIPPVAIFFQHYLLVTFVRFWMGFGNGLVVPCGSVLISRWFPAHERSTALAIFTVGNQAGLGIAMIITAKLCQVNFIGGWPLAFGVYGLVGSAFLLVWTTQQANKPRESRSITASELAYITGASATKARSMSVHMSTPWRRILLSPSVFAICGCSFAQSFVLVGLITYLPKFNQSAMQMNLASNGLWSAIPFFVQMVTKMLFGTVADMMKQRDASVNLVTKSANGIASFGCALCLLAIAGIGSSPDAQGLVTALFCIAMGLFSGYVPGYNTSIVTVAPQFTAAISSYGQLYAQAASASAPLLIGFMTKSGEASAWPSVFVMLAIVLIATGILFQFFGTARALPWGEIVVMSATPTILIAVPDAEVSVSHHGSVTTAIAPPPDGVSVHSRLGGSAVDLANARFAAEPDLWKELQHKRKPRVSYCEPTEGETDSLCQQAIREEEEGNGKTSGPPEDPNHLHVND